MKWWNIIKNCCAACGNLNKESGGVAFGGHGNDPTRFNIEYGGEEDDKDEEIDNTVE